MNTLHFTETGIQMASHDEKTLVWDETTDTFGIGKSLPEALEHLAENYPDNYNRDNKNNKDANTRECGCPTYD